MKNAVKQQNKCLGGTPHHWHFNAENWGECQICGATQQGLSYTELDLLIDKHKGFTYDVQKPHKIIELEEKLPAGFRIIG